MKQIAETTESIQRPAGWLRTVFLERKLRNPNYSMRAYARDLGMSQSLLSLILAGKRPVTIRQAAQISVLLGLTQEESQSFLEAALLSLPHSSKAAQKLKNEKKAHEIGVFKNLDVERFKVIGLWYHIAILDLSTTKDFQSDINWIAGRLGLSTVEARDAVERLLDLGFLEKTSDGFKKTEAKIYFSTQKSELAIRNFHKQMMDKAAVTLDQTGSKDFSRREISGITMAVRSDRIEEAKKRIQKFQKDLATYLTDGECDEVFQLNVQLFPLTKNI